MIEPLVYQPDALPDYLRWQILSFMRSRWPEGFTGSMHGRRWISLPEFKPVHIVLVEDDFLVAHAVVMHTTLDHNGETYTAYGLSTVFVYPDYRQQGMGAHVVQQANKYIDKQAEADIGLMWSDESLVDFYTYNGWLAMPQAVTLLGRTRRFAQYDPKRLLFMRFYSDKGIKGRIAFETVPVFFGWTTW